MQNLVSGFNKVQLNAVCMDLHHPIEPIHLQLQVLLNCIDFDFAPSVVLLMRLAEHVIAVKT